MSTRNHDTQSGAAPTPEVQSLTALLAHPLLQDPKFLATVGVLILALIFGTVSRSFTKKVSRRLGPATVLLVGPSDGGKTSLFAKLVQNAYPQTHTSILPSITTFPLSSPDDPAVTKSFRLLDLPGHPRLKDELKKYIAEASAVVFVVDIVGIVRNAGTVVEQLPPLLTALASQSMRNPSLPQPKILFLAHKSDLLIRPAPPTSICPPNIPATIKATATERLKSILTREMDRLKSARGASSGKIEGMGKVAGTSSGSIFGRFFRKGAAPVDEGVEGEDDETLIWGGKGPFRWEDVEGVDIEWGSSGLGMVKVGREAEHLGEEQEGDGLDDLKNFFWDA